MKSYVIRKSIVFALVIGCLISCGTGYAGIESLVVPYKAIEDVVYGQKEGMGLTLDVLAPAQHSNGLGIILISSGSFKSSKSNILAEEEEKRLDHWGMGLLSNGFTVFVVRHGSGPRFRVTEMIEDVRRSVRFVRLHAAEYAIDPDRIGITSGSSGGYLALMVGVAGDDGNPKSKDPVERVSSRVQAIVAWFPAADLINYGVEDGYKIVEVVQPDLFKNLLGEITDLPAQLKELSPINHVTPDDPPLLLIHGNVDQVVPVQQSEVMKEKYEAVGLPVKLIVQPGGEHTYWDGIEKHYTDVAKWFSDAPPLRHNDDDNNMK